MITISIRFFLITNIIYGTGVCWLRGLYPTTEERARNQKDPRGIVVGPDLMNYTRGKMTQHSQGALRCSPLHRVALRTVL